MSKDQQLNVKDLPADFFVQDSVPQAPAAPQAFTQVKNVKDLPADFFVEEDQPQKVFLDHSQEMVEAPTSMLGRLSNIATGAYAKGDAAAELNSIYYRKLLGDNDPKLDDKLKTLTPISETEIHSHGLMQEAIRATSEQTPQLIAMAKKAILRGSEGAGIGAGIGAVRGLIAGPEGAAAGAAAMGARGFILGGSAGIAENSFIQNAGNSYAEYKNLKDKNGTILKSDEDAKLAAMMVGAASAGLDVLPVSSFIKLFPGGNAVLDKVVQLGGKTIMIPKGGKSAIASFVADLSKAVGLEVATENAQEGLQILGGEVVKNISDQDFAPATSKEVLSRLENITKETLLSVIPLAGAAGTARIITDTRAAKKSSPIAQTAPIQETVAATPTIQDKITKISQDNAATAPNSSVEVPVANFTEAEQKTLKDSGLVNKNETVTVPTAEQNLAEALNKIQTSRNTETSTVSNTVQSEGDKTILEGRLKNLDDNISNLDSNIDRVTKLLDKQQQDSKPTVKIEKSLNSLLEQRDQLDQQRADILNTQNPRTTLDQLVKSKDANAIVGKQQGAIEVKSEALKAAENSDITLKASKIREIGQDTVRQVNASFREGRSIAKKDVSQAQNFITDVITNSDLKASDKSKFIDTIKNIQDAETLTKKLPAIQSRISRLVEQEAKRSIKGQIKSILKDTKVSKQSGKPIGKFGAETQKTLDRLRKASKLKAEKAQETFKNNIEKNAENAKLGILPTYESALENSVVGIAAGNKKMSVSDMESLRNEISQIKSEGKTSREKTLLAKKIKNDEIKNSIIQLVSRGENLRLKDPTATNDIVKGLVAADAWVNGSWHSIVDTILYPDKTNPELKTRIVQELNFSKNIQQEKGITRVRRDKFINAAKEAFGLQKENAVNNKFFADSKEKNIGIFKNAAGEITKLRYSVAEARKFWMELQDPTLKETITSEDGMAYTPEMIKAITDTLSSEDISFAKKQLELYKDFYPEINKVYSRVYGVDLPSIENYSPVSRMIDKELDSNVGEFLQETFVRLSAASGSLKSRVNSLGELRKRSDIEVYQKHIVEMSHFIAMQEKIQQLQNIFGDKKVRENIELQFGKRLNELLDYKIETFAKNGAIKSDFVNSMLNFVNAGFARSVLGGKLALAAKQTTSTLVYWEDIPTKDFVSGMADFIKNPKEAISVLNKSELMQARGVAEVDLANLGRTIPSYSDKAAKLKKNYEKFTDLMLLPVKFGDKGAIYMGGWSYYKYQLKQGLSHEEALAKFDEFTAKTQQSADIDQVTSIQTSNAFAKTFTLFLTAPNAYYRAEMTAIRKFARSEITAKELGKKIFIYHILLPSFFQFVANGFTFDDKDQLVAVATGPLNGFLLLGNVIENAIRAVSLQDFFTKSIPFYKASEELVKGISEAAKSGGEASEVFDAMLDISKGTGRVVGLPVDQAKNMAEGVDDFQNDKPVRGALRFAGWPKKSVEEIDE